MVRLSIIQNGPAMNKNYQKGRRKEYKLKHLLEKAGYIVIRSAGSHSFSDLIALDREHKTITFIQCKPSNFSKKAKERLEKEYAWINDEFTTEFTIQ